MKRLMQFVFHVVSIALLVVTTQLILKAQVRPLSRPPAVSADKSNTDPLDDQAPNALEWELRAKRAIKFAEKEHQENLSRAREASQLGSAIATAYKENKSLNSSDLKKLEKLEKLTKKIRNEVGASDDSFELERKPNDLAEAIDSLAKTSASLSDRVIKTPRQVVSTSIIEEANVLLELIRVVRGFVAQ